MQPPHSSGGARPAEPLPAGACDCHMHLFDSALPFARTATLRHGDASVEDYRQLQARLGMERCVIVQPSSYGVDHRVLLAGLYPMGEAARGVAVVTPETSGADLQTLAAHGVVGVRFNLVQRGPTHEGMVGEVAARARSFGWHLQFHLWPADLLRLEGELSRLPAPVVLDHCGRMLSDPGLGLAPLRALDRLLATGKVWMKLSAPYLAVSTPNETERLVDSLAPLAARHADRLVWGTDWPHVTETVKPDDGMLLDLLSRCMAGHGLRDQVFSLNASELYGFGVG